MSAYLVIRVPEQDLRTLIYAPEGQRSITVTHEQEVAILGPDDLRNLNLLDDATALAEDLARPDERCKAAFGYGGMTCQRATGHPRISEDGIGHSDAARHQGL